MRPGFVLLAISSAVLALGALAGCQTGRIHDFEKVRVGMNKAQVLGLVGGPDRTRRWQGKDRWTYVFKNDGREVLDDVHFEEGQVVYAGAPPIPKVSAAEQDRINEETNVREDARTRALLDSDRTAVRARALKIESDADYEHRPQWEPIQ